MSWFEQALPHRAEPHGTVDPFDPGKCYKGGEFLPFYVPRPLMPQIDEQDYDDFLAFAHAKPVTIAHGSAEPNTLRAHQRIDRIRAERMPPEVRAKPVFVSDDNYILDGNHRWMMHVLLEEPINFIRIGLLFEQAIALMFEFPKTYSLEHKPEGN